MKISPLNFALVYFTYSFLSSIFFLTVAGQVGIASLLFLVGFAFGLVVIMITTIILYVLRIRVLTVSKLQIISILAIQALVVATNYIFTNYGENLSVPLQVMYYIYLGTQAYILGLLAVRGWRTRAIETPLQRTWRSFIPAILAMLLLGWIIKNTFFWIL